MAEGLRRSKPIEVMRNYLDGKIGGTSRQTRRHGALVMLRVLAATCMIAMAVLFLHMTILLAAPVSSEPCSGSMCVDIDPLRWQEHRGSITLTFLGNTFNDDRNHVRIFFPPASVFVPATVNYTATVSASHSVGEVIAPNQGEILGLFSLGLTSRAPWEGTDAAPTDAHSAPYASAAPNQDDPSQSRFLTDWTMRLDYEGCATPIDCEFALYDEASLRCYWLNPAEGAWSATERRIDVDRNRLTCISNTSGLHAIVGRRAETSGETEAPPVYLPIVRLDGR